MNYSLSVQQKVPETVYSNEKGIKISPCSHEPGRHWFTDEYLAQVYRRIVSEETVHKVFHDGSVKNTNDFIKFIRNKDNEIYFVEYDGKEAGFFWLTRFLQKSAFIGYCFYKNFWGRKTLTVSQLCIDYIFNKKDEYEQFALDVLLGLTPANNKLAIKFLLKNGMTVLGKIPGILYNYTENAATDGILSFKHRNCKSKYTLASFFLT